MGFSSYLGRFFRSVGRGLGLCSLDGLGPSSEEGSGEGCADSGVGEGPRSQPDCAYYRSQVDAHARLIVDNYRGSTPRIPPQELSRRAERRLRLVESGE
jgi:hypothetical protein